MPLDGELPGRRVEYGVPTGSYTPGGVLVALDVWWLDGEVVGLRGVAQGLDAHGDLSGELVPQPLIGRQGGRLERTEVLSAAAHAVWSEGSLVELGYQPVRAVGLSEDPEPVGLSEQAVVRRAPPEHVLVGLHCEVLHERIVTITGFFDTRTARLSTEVGKGSVVSGRGQSPTVANRWQNTLIHELIALREAGASVWTHWPADERRMCPLEVVVPVPDAKRGVLWIRARRQEGDQEPLVVRAAGQELTVAPQGWSGWWMLYRVPLESLAPGPTTLTFHTEGPYALVVWLELTAGALPA